MNLTIHFLYDNIFAEMEQTDIKKTQFRRSQLICAHAVLCALVILFVVFPIQLGFASLAVIPLIAVVISAELFGLVHGIFTGLFFGIVSLVGSFIQPSLLSFAFQNPLISVFPRILIGIVSYLSCKGFQKFFPRVPKFFGYAVGAGAGVITNTAGVLGLLLAFHYGKNLTNDIGQITGTIALPLIGTILLTNTLFEFIATIIITPPVIVAVKKGLRIGD